ncbi:MAG: CBS domain-containing protein [Candidatus Thorarchaeota archaeon]
MSTDDIIQDLTIAGDELPRLQPGDQARKALPYFEKGDSTIMILEPSGSFYGVICDRDMLKKRANANTTMKSLSRPIPALATEEEDPIRIARLMLDGDTRIVPILDDHKRLRRAYVDLLVAEATISHGLVDDIRIDSIVDKAPITCQQGDTLGRAVSLVRDHSLSAIPVLEDKDQVHGIIATRDLCLEILQPRHATTVGDIAGKREASWIRARIEGFIKPSPFVPPETTILEAIRIMKVRDAPMLVIAPLEVSERGFGTLIPRDILHYISVATMTEGYTVAVSGAPDSFVHNLAIEKAQRLIDHEAGYVGDTGQIHVRFKKAAYQSKRGLWQYECAVRLRSSKGHTIAVDTAEFGGEKSLNAAFDKLGRVIRSRKGAAIGSRRKRQMRKSAE